MREWLRVVRRVAGAEQPRVVQRTTPMVPVPTLVDGVVKLSVVAPCGADGLPNGYGFLEPAEGGMVRVSNGRLIVEDPPTEAGEGPFRIPGVGRGTVAWDAEGCVSATVWPAEAGVYGAMEGEGIPDTEATVNGCGAPVAVRDGSFYLDAVPGEPCTLRVFVEGHGLRGSGPEVTVTPVLGTDVEVRLRYPTALRTYTDEEIEWLRGHVSSMDACGEACRVLHARFAEDLREAEEARGDR